jgi:hypothetical protein
MKKYIVEYKKISKQKQNKMKNIILSNYNFNRITDLELENLRKKIDIDGKIILSYRSQLLKEINMNNHYKVKNKLKMLLKDYQSIDILDLSKKYKLSPVSLMRLILKKKYPNIKSIKKSILNFNSFDKEQLELAEKNDNIAPLDQDNIQIRSEEYEDKIGKYLDKKNIKYKNQDALVQEQIKEKGHPYATPDFLLEEPIEINGTIVNWLEIKNFYGTNIKFMNKKIQKQINKYFNKWGPGCLVFRYGIYENVQFDNCTIISF